MGGVHAAMVFGMAATLILGCASPETPDRSGPDAVRLPVEPVSMIDGDMWGPWSECRWPDAADVPEVDGQSAPEVISDVTAFDAEDAEQVEGCGRHSVWPPVDGDWSSEIANCGFYPSAVPAPLAVSALRRGAVWIVYRPDVDDDDLEAIRDAAVRSGHVLASATDAISAPIVLSAWRRQLELDSASDPRFDDFIDTFTNSRLVPDINGICRSGKGTPQDVYR